MESIKLEEMCNAKVSFWFCILLGEKRRLVIPSDLAYGKGGAGDTIPPDATLIFETELIKIERKDEL